MLQINETFLLLSFDFVFLAAVAAETAPATKITNASTPSLIQQQSAFATILIPHLYSNNNNNSLMNQCSSAWGVSMALDLLFTGATESTSTQMSNLLGFDPSRQHQLQWADLANQLETMYDGSCDSYCDEDSYDGGSIFNPTVSVANSIWLDDDDELQDQYKSIVGNLVHQIDFNNSSAGDQVNEWVKEESKGLIDAIVDRGTIDNTMLLVVNSIYFNAEWVHKFSERYTGEDIFYTDAGRDSIVLDRAHFMHEVEFFSYSHDALPGYQILRMPYARSRLSMILALPINNNTQPAAPLSAIVNAIPLLGRQRIALALPKFQYDTTYDLNLKMALMDSGLTLPFSLKDDGGFCGLVMDSCLWIEKIIQKTSIHVKEDGTLAAAVTSIALPGAAPPPPDQPILFLADHPFQFVIYDSTVNLVLFEGLVADASVPKDSVASFDSNHSDSAFWSENFGIEPWIVPQQQSELGSSNNNSNTMEPLIESEDDLPGASSSPPVLNGDDSRGQRNEKSYSPTGDLALSSPVLVVMISFVISLLL